MSLTNAYFNVTFGIEAELPESFSAGTMRVCTDTKNVYLDLDSSRIKLSVTAEQLETARTIRTNLASTTAASFDGTNNITPGVTGTLPVANGGTGATSASAARTALGAAAASHGTHVTYGTGAPKSAGTASAGTETTVSRSDHVHPAQTTVSGNAGSATKLATSRSIDGVNFNGTSDITHYGTCSTAAATAAKVVSCTGFKLATGSKISVKFTVTNTAASPTLNVNSTGAKAIRYRGSAISAGNLAANRVYTFVYDGTAYELIGDIDTNTTYSTGTATTAGLTKLYTSTGTAADGTMTQNAITTALNGKSPTSHTHSVASTTANGFLRKLDGSTAHFMRGDGTWATPPNTTYSTMKGATSSAAGSTGLVPAPAAGKHTSFLRGDGTWATPPNTTYSNMTGATSSAAGKAGLVPAPAAGAATRYLRSDGTWSVPPDTNTTYTLSSFGITATAAELNKLDGVTTTATELNYVDGVTSNIQTQLNNKAPSSHTHKYAGSSSAGGSANSAVKLATARTISLGTGVTGTATSFDGSANITIPVTSVKEAYLSWGGRNYAGSFGPLDASLVSELGANRFAFGKPAGITIEYSTDAGKTWLDYGASDASKVNLLTTATTLTVGKATTSNKATANSMLRVTLKMNSLGLYTALNKFAINVSTNGSNGCYCTIDASTHKTPTTFTTIANKIPLSGWSGWNIINPTSYTYGGTVETYYGILRFTFGISSNTSVNYAGLQVMSIYGYGGMGWTLPSTMAYNGHIYSYDSGQNATFPAAITAKSFSGPLTGNATTASTLQTARTINGTSFNGSANITTANWGTARTITIGNSGKSVNGSKNVSWSLSEIGAAASSHTHTATQVTGLTANRALISNSSGNPAVSSVTSTELGYLDGVTSSIQTQLNGKQATITGGASTITSSNLTANRALISNASGKVTVSAVTSTELGYLDGVTSAIQTQLNGKAPSSHNHSAANITSGTLAIARGGTGATTASAARTNLGIIVSATAPSDTTAIWIKPAT